MNPYGLFAEDAIRRYKELPEEQNELYKRKYVSLSHENLFDIFSEGPSAEDNVSLDALAKTLFINSAIRFDAIITGDSHLLGPNVKNITVISPQEVRMDTLERKLYKSADDKLAALIHAFTNKIIFIDVPKGTKSNINILFINTGRPLAAQVMINAGEESNVEILEWYASTSKKVSALGVMHEGEVGSYSNVSIDAVHNENAETVAVGLSKYKVKDGANLHLNYFYNGGSNTRVKNVFDTVAPDASVHANELVFGSAKQKFDLTSSIQNTAPSTTAELLQRSALMNESSCIMKGFAKIPFGSKNAKSFVHEYGMLLDKTAYLDSIPAMSIDENEVKATHSSATGPIDEELIFYLMSKGLDEKKAKKLLVEGFLSSSVGRFKSASAKLAAASLVAEKMEKGDFGVPVKISTENIWVGRENEEDIFKGHYKYR